MLCLCASHLLAPAGEAKGQATLAAQNADRAAANTAFEAHDYAQALKLLMPLAAASPKDARLRYDLGSAQDALDQGSAAEASYRAAIATDAAFLEPRVALGLLLARGGRVADARGELVGALTLESEDKALRARAYRALARLDEKTRPADARDELLEALKLSPETREDTLLSAELAQSAGNGQDAAEAAYRRVLAREPNDPEATSALAHLLLRVKRAPEAEALLTKGLAAHPMDVMLTVELAAVYGAEDRPGDAIPLVESLHRATPQNTDVSLLLGRLYLDAREYSQAEPLLGAASRQRPQDGALADEYASALIHLKRSAEAQAVLARAVAQPQLFRSPAALGEAAGHLAFAASQNGQPAEALRALALHDTVLTPSAPTLFLLAISHDKLHQIKLAQQAYRQFLEVSKGTLPDEEFEARHRLITLEHSK